MGRCVKRKKRTKAKLIAISVLLLLVFGVYAFTVFFIRPVVGTVSQEEIRARAVMVVNTAVRDSMDGNQAYDKLTEVVRGDDGNILLIETNTSAINALNREIVEKAQSGLIELSEHGIDIPIGSLSGITFLAGRGPKVKIKTIPIGNIDTVFSSQFIQAGINQTLHKLFINLSAAVSIIIPGAESKFCVQTSVMIGESIIIGKVPDFYFETQGATPSLNLVP